MADLEDVQISTSREAIPQEIEQIQEIRRDGALDRNEMPGQGRHSVTMEEWSQMGSQRREELFDSLIEDSSSPVETDSLRESQERASGSEIDKSARAERVTEQTSERNTETATAITFEPAGRAFGTYGNLELTASQSPALYETYTEATKAGVKTEYYLGEKDGQGEFKLTFNGTSVTVPVDINGNWQQDLLAGYNDLSRRSSHASSSPTTTPASDVDISKMSRAEMEKAFVELSQDAAIQQTQAERLLTLEQNLRTIPRARFRTDEEYQVAVQQEMNKWSNDVERAEARQGQDIARDLQRAQGDYDREYRNATNKATNVAREQIAIENRINMRAERIRAKQNDFANDVREVKGLTRVEQAWNTIGTLDIPKKNREPIVDYLGSDVMTRKEESVRLMDEQLDRYSSVEHRDFGDPSTMLSQMDDEKLRSMLSNLQGQRNEASARYSNVRERLDQYSDDAAFEDAIEGTMDQVRSTAVATQTERATLEAMRLETQQLKEFTTEAQTALLQARNADQSFGTYETEMNGRHQAARGALQNWKKGQDASILGGAAKTAEKEARREIDEAIKRGVGRIFGR